MTHKELYIAIEKAKRNLAQSDSTLMQQYYKKRLQTYKKRLQEKFYEESDLLIRPEEGKD